MPITSQWQPQLQLWVWLQFKSMLYYWTQTTIWKSIFIMKIITINMLFYLKFEILCFQLLFMHIAVLNHVNKHLEAQRLLDFINWSLPLRLSLSHLCFYIYSFNEAEVKLCSTLGIIHHILYRFYNNSLIFVKALRYTKTSINSADVRRNGRFRMPSQARPYLTGGHHGSMCQYKAVRSQSDQRRPSRN